MYQASEAMKHARELKHFKMRVECVERSALAPLPAEDISNDEIIAALYSIIEVIEDLDKRLRKSGYAK